MVQKMGWTEGKGLGKDNAGITKHLWTKKRVDAVGIGAETTNDWGAHSVQTNVYNSLLSKLSVIINNSDGSSSSSSETDSDSSSESTEAKIENKAATKGGLKAKKAPSNKEIAISSSESEGEKPDSKAAQSKQKLPKKKAQPSQTPPGTKLST